MGAELGRTGLAVEAGHASFTEFVRARSDRFGDLAWLITRNAEDARDAVQDAFVGLYRRWDDLPTGDEFEAYVHRSVVNACLGVIRWRPRSLLVAATSTDSVGPVTPVPTPPATAAGQVRVRIRNRAGAALDEVQVEFEGAGFGYGTLADDETTGFEVIGGPVGSGRVTATLHGRTSTFTFDLADAPSGPASYTLTFSTDAAGNLAVTLTRIR